MTTKIESEIIFISNSCRIERVVLPENTSTRIHKHRLSYEKVFVERGQINITLYNGLINDSAFLEKPSENKFLLIEGESTCTYPNKIHNIDAIEESVLFIIYFTKLGNSDEVEIGLPIVSNG